MSVRLSAISKSSKIVIHVQTKRKERNKERKAKFRQARIMSTRARKAKCRQARKGKVQAGAR